MIDKVLRGIQKVNELGWTGDVSIGALAALAVGLATYYHGPGKEVWGMPASMVWAGLAFTAAFFASLTLYATKEPADMEGHDLLGREVSDR